MLSDTYDLIAIGAGPAGESATELASFFGHRSAVIEKNGPGALSPRPGVLQRKHFERPRSISQAFVSATSMACGSPRLPRSPRTSFESAPGASANCFKRLPPTISRSATWTTFKALLASAATAR
jgi:hypothetical protein